MAGNLFKLKSNPPRSARRHARRPDRLSETEFVCPSSTQLLSALKVVRTRSFEYEFLCAFASYLYCSKWFPAISSTPILLFHVVRDACSRPPTADDQSHHRDLEPHHALSLSRDSEFGRCTCSIIMAAARGCWFIWYDRYPDTDEYLDVIPTKRKREVEVLLQIRIGKVVVFTKHA